MRLLLFTLLTAIMLLTACEVDDPEDPTTDAPAADDPAQTETPVLAAAVLEPTEGNQVTGTVNFLEAPDGIRVRATIEGLEPNTTHGFHIHEEGDCSAPDGTSAGGHFNPTDDPHGGPNDPADQRHVGDLGNLESNADGVATYERVDDLLTVEGNTSILGRGMIVHAGTDDLESQPTGDAGARLACGVIEAVEATP
jgi:Cu-Zn family superoxide dismutase